MTTKIQSEQNASPGQTPSDFARLLKLALPVVGSHVGYMMFGVVDMIMVGRVGPEAIGAVNLGNAWALGTMLFGMGLVYGIDPIISQAYGAGNVRRMGLALQRGIILALAVSVPLALLWAFTEPALLLAKQSEQVSALAQKYVWVQIPSIPFYLVFLALRQHLQSREHVIQTLVLTLLVNVLNAFANWVLIFGHLGAPELGVVGSGIATSITRAMLLIGLWFWVKRRHLLKDAWVPWSRESFSSHGLRECLHYGLPVGITMGLEIWAFQISTLMAGRLGTIGLASHSIVMNMASLSFMVPLGISFGASTRVGNLIGAGENKRAQHAAWVALAMGAGVMAFFALCFLMFRTQLPRVYSSDAEVIALCATILPVVACFQLFDGTQVVGSGILRGMGRTRPAMYINLIGYYVLGLPLAWWLSFKLDWGLIGIWWGLALGLASVAVLLTYWVRSYGPASLQPKA